MKIPTQNDLASPLALKRLVEKLWNGECDGIEALSPLLLELGYWSHWPIDTYYREDIDEIIKEGLEIPHIWDQFQALSENKNQRWQFGNHEILKRHPAYKDGDRISQAALVALNPHAMPSNAREIHSDPKIDIDFMGLGGCETIGASCYAYRVGNDVILVDLGINPDTNTLPSMEKLPEDWKANLRGIVLSHLHADHASGLPHLDSLGFIGEQYLGQDLPIYCTEVTKQLFSHVLRIGLKNEISPWDADERLQLLEKSLCPLQTGVWHNLPKNLSLKLIEQPHVPGAALIEIESSGGRLLHAVDFAMDRSLGGNTLDLGWLSFEEISVVVLESTYGHVTSEGHLRQLRIPALFDYFMNDLDQQFESKRARVLFPAFSLGRAQELADRLEQRKSKNTILGGAAKAISQLVHEIEPKWMNAYSDLSENHSGYRNIVASHGWMLKGTKAYECYKGLRSDDAVVFTGYIKGDTPAHLLTEPKRTSEGPRIVALPFSSHASLSQLLALVTASGAGRVVLVHGERVPNSELSIDYLLWKNGIAVERPRVSEMLAL